MHKGVKIAIKTLTSIIGGIILLVGLVFGLLNYVLFTPARLTPIVTQVCDSLLLTPYSLSRVDLTLWHTFPQVGLEIDSLYILRPMPGAPSDTLLGAPKLYVGVDVQRYLDDRTLTVTSLELPDVMLNAYIDAQGQTNWELSHLLRLSSSPKDTTSSGVHLPFAIELQHLLLTTSQLRFRSDADALDLDHLSLSLQAAGQADSLLTQCQVQIRDLTVGWNDVHVSTTGEVSFSHMDTLWLDVALQTNPLFIASTIASLPKQYARLIPSDWCFDGQLSLQADVQGPWCLSDTTLRPKVQSTVHLNQGQVSYASLPLQASGVQAQLRASAELSDWQHMVILGKVNAHELAVQSDSLNVRAYDTNVQFHYPKTDSHYSLFSNIISANLRITVDSAQGHCYLKDSLGQTSLATLNLHQSQIEAEVEYDRLDTMHIPCVQASFAWNQADGQMDSLQAAILGAQGKMQIRGGYKFHKHHHVDMSLSLDSAWIMSGQHMSAQTGYTSLQAQMQHTDNKLNFMTEWQPHLHFEIHHASATTPVFKDSILVPQIDLDYSSRNFHIDTSRIVLGRSDFSLAGDIYNIGAWVNHEKDLTGELRFTSAYTDVSQLLSYVSALDRINDQAHDEDEDEDVNENANENANVNNDTTQASTPFMVPSGVDLSVLTHIREAKAFDQIFHHLGGQVYIRDSALVIDQMGLVCNAAQLQLSALYKTPRRNHLYLGLDYHMTQIHIEELIDMIPQVDSLLPMLRSFKGQANFHLAAETYLKDDFTIKPSTCRAACSVDAKDLTLLDGETFTKIAKILTFKKSTENKIDSISAQISLYKSQINVYPFLITCDKWRFAVGGEHNLDMSFNYHINVLSPIYLGVGVSGTFDDLKIRPETCIYAKEFRPARTKQIDNQATSISTMIRSALESKMKPHNNQSLNNNEN